MRKYGSVKAVLAGTAVIAMAGCGHPTSTIPNVLTGSSTAPAHRATAAATGDKALGSGVPPSTPGRASPAPSSPTPVPSASSKIPSSAIGTSIPFPVAVGDTWVYQTQSSVAGRSSGSGTTITRIVAAGPASAGYRVAMASTSEVAGLTTNTEPVFYFHSDGTIAWPVEQAGGISAEASVRWPDAAGLLYGSAYHSVLPVRVSVGGSVHYGNATVTVQGAGTSSVTVPAGTYNALLVKMTFSAKLGSVAVTTVISNWLASSAGPVKTQAVTTEGGKTELVTTSELVKFSKGFSQAGGS